VFDRRVSLAAGAGPYLYYDTVSSSTNPDPSNGHGVGVVTSLTATLYTESRFLVQARADWVWTPQNANAYVATLGVGYQLEKPTSAGPLTGYSRQSDQAPLTTKNEITLLAGGSILNSSGMNALAASLEYRRSLTRYLDWTIGWLNEGASVSRTGPISQIWAGRSFFDNQLALGLGAGPYLAYDTHDRNVTNVNWLVGATVSYRFLPEWAIRVTYNRVTTNSNHDTDIVVAGLGYRF
jgi:opacity protein-like surface antigen